MSRSRELVFPDDRSVREACVSSAPPHPRLDHSVFYVSFGTGPDNFLATINYVLFGAMHWFLYQIFVSTSSDKLFRNLLNLLFWVVCKFVLLSIKYPVKALGLAAVVSGVCLEKDNPTLTV